MMKLLRDKSIDVTAVWMALLSVPFIALISVMLWVIAPGKMVLATVALFAIGYSALMLETRRV